MMRILFVLHGFPPKEARGTELYSFYLLQEFIKQGHEVHVFHPVRRPERPEYELSHGSFEGIPWTTINFTYRLSTGFESDYETPAITDRFKEFLKEWRPDIVHFHHLISLSLSMVPAAAETGAGVLFTLHDFWLLCPRGQMLRRDLSPCDKPEPARCAACKVTLFPISRVYKAWAFILEKLAIRRHGFPFLRKIFHGLDNLFARGLEKQKPELAEAVRRRQGFFYQLEKGVDIFISPSLTVRRRFIEAGVAAGKILHSANGYPVQHFSRFQRKPSKVLRFGLIGTFIPSKGVDLLIQAFNTIGTRDVVLNLFGQFFPYEGFLDYENYVRSLIRHPGIHFRKEFQHHEIAECLSEIDVLIVPSIWLENAPLTIQEAFLSATPVIASRQGGMAEMVQDGKNGLLFRPRDALDLREKMRRFLNEPELLGTLQSFIKDADKKRPAGIKTIQEDACFLSDLYKSLTAEKKAASRNDT